MEVYSSVKSIDTAAQFILRAPPGSDWNGGMARTNGDDAGWRGSANVWLTAAYDELIESGVEAVRIMPLAKRLRLSRTSFYWFFKDRETLLEALIDLWREKNTGCIVKQADAYAESVTEALLNVMDCWFNRELFDSKFEYAVRSWALQSPEVATDILRADKIRLKAFTRLFVRHGLPSSEADVRARTVYLTQIGYISMKTEERLAERMSRIPHYVEIFAGQAPTQRELDRFYARHGHRARVSPPALAGC
jgi:AcrR family transcriptional regulator